MHFCTICEIIFLVGCLWKSNVVLEKSLKSPWKMVAIFCMNPGLRRSTFHERHFINWIKYTESSASESIRNACFNLEPLSCSFCLVWPDILTLECLWFRCWSFHVPNLTAMYFISSLTGMSIFSLSEFSSVGIKIGFWINSAGLNNLSRPYLN